MIHAVQYEISLTTKLDYFNDILPICIDIRRMLKYSEVPMNIYENKHKIIVFGHEKFAHRFNICSLHSSKYQSILNKLSSTNCCITYEDQLYTNVKIYKNKIKHNPENQTPIDKEKFNELENAYNEIETSLNSYKKYEIFTQSEIQKLEYDKIKLHDVLEIQRCVQNEKYFNKLIAIEKELTNIELSEEENNILQKVLNHPKLNGIIEFHGFNLVELKKT
jgi:hypothetical protein